MELGLSLDEFLDLSPAQYVALSKAKAEQSRRRNRRVGVLTCTIRRMFGGDDEATPLDGYEDTEAMKEEIRERKRRTAIENLKLIADFEG